MFDYTCTTYSVRSARTTGHNLAFDIRSRAQSPLVLNPLGPILLAVSCNRGLGINRLTAFLNSHFISSNQSQAIYTIPCPISPHTPLSDLTISTRYPNRTDVIPFPDLSSIRYSRRPSDHHLLSFHSELALLGIHI